MDVELIRSKGGIYKFKGAARVGEQVACEAEIMCTMRTFA
jgi:3-hydroxyacyl-[acyl-carrier-protein] dehydratase